MKKYHHLTYEQRCQIFALNKRKISQSQIAAELGVATSTISRELKRNTGGRGYRFKQAQRLSEDRRKAQYVKFTRDMIDVVHEKLMSQWSPQQISGWLRKQGKSDVSHERIYQYIWRDKQHGGQLYKQLRRCGKKYNKRSKFTAGRGFIKDRVDIDQRPAVVESKERLGDWELDTIISSGHKGALVSMVDRASKLTRLIKVGCKKAQNVTDAILRALIPLKRHTHTLTADNGKEFANHKRISNILEANFYFAKPYRSWERGLNEHTNGLVRQYFPKSTNFSEITDVAVKEVENLLNKRPRAVLDFCTPEEVFYAKAKLKHNVALHT